MTTSKTIDIRSLFNPVLGCGRGLDEIYANLEPIPSHAMLEVICSELQIPDVRAWLTKFQHKVVQEREDTGRYDLLIEKDGLAPT